MAAGSAIGPVPHPIAVGATTPNLLIVDEQLSVVLAAATDIWEAEGVSVQIGRIVPAVLQTLVRSAIASLPAGGSEARCVRIAPWPGIALTIYTVTGAQAPLIAVVAQRFLARQNLRHAQRTYGLSPRELEILAHVLGGLGTSQIAVVLNIADSTVTAHIKSLLIKTKAANRAALAARVLGWEEPFAT